MTSPDQPQGDYIAEFIDGPFQNRTEARVLVHGRHEPRVAMMAGVESVISTLWYDEVDSRDVQGKLHVRYAFDASDSDPVEADEQPDSDLQYPS
ncbi:MAG: hypothetical protein JWQ68_1908 [Cryobacterium sp.]|jgi:hypothetical protein|nr:hypothetical protein [Cryobacterium sp.]